MTKYEFLSRVFTADLKKGDAVRVIKKAHTSENGWSNSWVPEMNEAIGRIGRIEYIDHQWGVHIYFEEEELGGYSYPCWCVEKVTKIKKGKNHEPQ